MILGLLFFQTTNAGEATADGCLSETFSTCPCHIRGSKTLSIASQSCQDRLNGACLSSAISISSWKEIGILISLLNILKSDQNKCLCNSSIWYKWALYSGPQQSKTSASWTVVSLSCGQQAIYRRSPMQSNSQSVSLPSQKSSAMFKQTGLYSSAFIGHCLINPMRVPFYK